MKRIAKLLLLAALAALLAPMAQAAGYELAVAGRQVTDANKDDILGDGGSVRFSLTGTNGTLTLSNAAITNVLGDYLSQVAGGVPGIVAADLFTLTIVLEGSNVVKAVPNTGIYATWPLTITGGGSLSLVPNEGFGIVACEDLTIDGVTVSAGGSSGGGIECLGNLTITNADVTASNRDSRNGIVCKRLSIGGASRLEAITTGTASVEGKKSALWFKNGIEIGDGLVVLEPSPYWIADKTIHAEGDSGVDGALRVVIAAPPPPVPYFDPAIGTTDTCETYTLYDGRTELTDGWWVVADSRTVGNRITVSGDVHLILVDGRTLTAPKGVNVGVDGATTNSLTIWAQSDGAEMGVFFAGTTDGTNVTCTEFNAGIGSANNSVVGSITINGGAVTAMADYGGAGIGGTAFQSGGTIEINGGTVTATSGGSCAGIGGGSEGGSGGKITINGGTVTATGGIDAAGVGGGNSGGAGGEITINGGTVTATAGGNAAGIGGGYKGNGGTIAIAGGTVNARGGWGGAGIGGGRYGGVWDDYTGDFRGWGGSGGTVTITGGTVVAEAGDYNEYLGVPVYLGVPPQAIGHGAVDNDYLDPADDYPTPGSGSISFYDDAAVFTNALSQTPVAGAEREGACRGAWARIVPGSGGVPYLDPTDPPNTNKVCRNYTLYDGRTTLDGGWWVVADSATNDERIVVSGDVNLILCDGASLTASEGVNVAVDGATTNSLTIWAQSDGEGMGALTATGGGHQAGIGGDDGQNGGTITLNGGTVTAIAGNGAQAIGHGSNASDEGDLDFPGTYCAYSPETDSVPVDATNRMAVCRGGRVKLAPCDPHGYADYRNNGDDHTRFCRYCGAEGATEAHVYGSDGLSCPCGARRYAITVEGGSTTNSPARAGETVTVVANAPEEGHGFVEWSADDAMDLSFATAAAATTTFAMPARAVTVTAVFKEIQIASIPDQEWTGGPVEPEFRSDTVKFKGTDMVLLPGTDYTVSYTNNVDPGTATATVTMAPPRTGSASATFTILPPPEPPSVSNVVARQRWPWNGLVDVDYEVGGDTNLLAGVTARITFEEQIEGGTGRIWVASNFLAGAEPSVEPGLHRATWDTAADGVTDVVAAVKATVNLVRIVNEKGIALASKTVIVTPVDPDSNPSCVVVNGNYYLLTDDPHGIPIDFRFGSGCDSAKVGDVVGITLDPEIVHGFFGDADSGEIEYLSAIPSQGVRLVDPATGDKVDSLEKSADGSIVLFVTADQVVLGGSITVHGNGKTVVIDNINFYDSVPEGWVGVVVTSAASAEFRLDTREGPLPSDGTETLTYSTLWHPAGDATVTILQDGEEEPVASGLLDEGGAVWQVFEDGIYTLTHKTVAGDATVSAGETATFVVTGHPPVEAALRWKYAKNANGWHCAQVALKWHPSFAREISDMRLLFADRYEGEEPLAVIKALDDEQAAFFPDFRLIKMAGEDGKYYFLDDDTGKVYSERFLESGYREKLEERPTVIDGDEAGTVSDWAGGDSGKYIDENGVLNDHGTAVSFELTVNGTPTLQLKFASSPHGLGRRTAYLVDPATVVDPLGSTETYRDVEYRVAPVDLTAFAGLADGARAVYGVSDATMASSLDSVPKAERKICLRVVNRDYSTVGWVDNKLAILAWNVGGSPRFLPIAETMASLRDDDDDPQPAPRPAPRPLSVAEANLSASFGLAPAAVARGAVTCRVSSMSFGEDGSVEGTFAVAAENAGGVVAESGELAGNVKFTVLGAENLAGAFEPLDPSCGAELLSRKPPYAFRVAAPGKNAFFKIRLEAEDVFE